MISELQYADIYQCFLFDCVGSTAELVPFVLFGTNTSRTNIVKCRQLPQTDDVSLYEYNGVPASHMVCH